VGGRYDYEAIKLTIGERVSVLHTQARAEAWKAFQKAPHVLDLAELESVALLGLAQAAARFISYNEARGYAPDDFRYFDAYCLRRMRGAILDAMRSQDWVTRSARIRAKKLRDVGQDQGATDEELAERSGMTIIEVRETMAAVAAKPVSIDAEPHDVADEADVEGQAVVSSVLGAATSVLAALDEGTRLAVVLKHYYALPLSDIAGVLGVDEEEAVRMHTDGVLAVYNGMLKAVAT
jgi:RNA polymerase sigma factor for flagellar operon FliA